jgi:hypothetical protein
VNRASNEVLRALGVTAEIFGMELSKAALQAMAFDLAAFDERQVFAALTRCRKELRTRFSLADILERIDDGRPGVEQAWAEIPRDEASSVVWCDEQRDAWGAARTLLAEGEKVQARMTFVEVYRRKVIEARERGEAPRWTPTLGHDAAGRADALVRAVLAGRMGARAAAELMPARFLAEPPPTVVELLLAAGMATADAGDKPRRMASLVQGLLTEKGAGNVATENGGGTGGGTTGAGDAAITGASA